jgi:hypothetical protein
LEKKPALRVKSRRRVRIHFYFYLQHLSARDLPDNLFSFLDDQQMLQGVHLQKCRLDRADCGFLPFCHGHIETEGPNLLLQGIGIAGKVEIGHGLDQGKIKVFGVTVYPVKGPKGCPPIKGSLFVKFASPEPEKGNLLQNFPKSPHIVFDPAAVVTGKHAGNCFIHDGSPPS